MEETDDSEKKLLIEPLGWQSSDSSGEEEEEEELRQLERLCRESDAVSGAEVEVRRSARRKLYAACGISLACMTGEVIGGYAAHSLAVMTDAAHLLTDFGSIAISIFSLWISARPQTQTMTFGWHRAEILGMLLSILSIWAVTALLVMSAVQRISDGDYDIDSSIMLLTSGAAVGVNVLMVLILHQSGASHGHSHGHHGHHGNASVKAAFIHVVGDLLQSVGVLLAATIIHFRPEYKVADPICTFLFSALVVGTTVPVAKDVFRILMQASPRHLSTSAVRELLLSLRGVVDVHNLHVWSLNTSRNLLSVHVSAEEDADRRLLLMKATKLLRSEFSFSSVTIQVEH